MPEHDAAGHTSTPSAVAGYKGLDVTARFLLHAAANARQCISDLTHLRQQGIETVILSLLPSKTQERVVCRPSAAGWDPIIAMIS